MTALKILPVRPSLESLRKQAKSLARETAAGKPATIARARAQLPDTEPPLSQRDAQLVLAREYGFAGWQDLREEVFKRTGKAQAWATEQAKQAVHDNDGERLKRLLAQYPQLIAWSEGSLLGAASPYGDCFDPEKEAIFTRPACAELLIDAGATVAPSVWNGVIDLGARGLLRLFWNRGLLPRTLRVLVALDDLDGVRDCFDASGALRAGCGDADERASVKAAFICACRFQHREIASLLLARCIALDQDLGRRIERGPGRDGFLGYLCGDPTDITAVGSGDPWQAFIMKQVLRAFGDDDLARFTRLLESEPWLLGETCIGAQLDMLERAAFRDQAPFIAALLDRDPAILHCATPPPQRAMVWALEYGNAHLVPLLTRLWPLPDDLPHAAAMGDRSRVERWFDASGRPALGDPHEHDPARFARPPGSRVATVQQILDIALAWACMNLQLEIADVLLAHGADINTRWCTHEPASILHECAVRKNYEVARFLIARGIDMTIEDHRWHGTAEGWARYAAEDEEMAEFLAAAQRHRAGAR